MHSQRGRANLPRYWITLNKEIIFDYPKQFTGEIAGVYPYETGVSAISELIRDYVDTPKEEILAKQFTNDHWGLIDIICAADRRVGLVRLESLLQRMCNVAAQKVIQARLGSASPP